MKSLSRMILVLLAKAVAVAVGVSIALVLLTDFRLGINSPGILAVAKGGLRFSIPLVFILIALWSAGTVARVVLLAQRRASAAGFSLLQYFDLSPEQKVQLPESDQEER